MFSDRSCKSLEVDAEAAVRIALKLPEGNWTNTTENQRPKVDDEVVEVEKTVGNATKDVENVKTSLHDLIVEGEEEEKNAETEEQEACCTCRSTAGVALGGQGLCRLFLVLVLVLVHVVGR